MLRIDSKNSLTGVKSRMAITRDQGEGMVDGEMPTNRANPQAATRRLFKHTGGVISDDWILCNK